MADQPQIRSADDVPSDTRRGGDVRTLLSPKSVGSTSGFMGMATIEPGDWIAEHYHPYSEEFIYVTSGEIVARLDGKPQRLQCGGIVAKVGAVLLARALKQRFEQIAIEIVAAEQIVALGAKHRECTLG